MHGPVCALSFSSFFPGGASWSVWYLDADERSLDVLGGFIEGSEWQRKSI